MVFKEGAPYLVVGAPGGSVIICAVLQAILNIIDFGMSPVEAVTVPRLHCEGAAIHLEARTPNKVCRALCDMGHAVTQSAVSFDPVMSRAHVALRDGAGWLGGADPRGGGGVAMAD